MLQWRKFLRQLKHNKMKFCTYFGNANDNVRYKNEYDAKRFLLLKEKIATETKKNLETLFFLKQTHSADVFLLNQAVTKPLSLFQHSGDAIITQKKNVGIGVVTADCLPIILYDPNHHAIAVIHAGWRGLSKKIITETIKKMQNAFGTNPSSLQAYLGPSAGVCCYEVQQDFLSHFPNAIFDKKIIENRSGKLFFNQRAAAARELVENQLSETAIDYQNNFCTLCTPGFCSARIQKENAGRQPTVVFLL